MNKSVLVQWLSDVSNYEEFDELQRKLIKIEEHELFNWLFEISLLRRFDNPSQMAGYLLIALEPRVHKNCSELIEQIANSRWDLSDKSIPLYLVSQFGKWNLKKCIDEYLQNKLLNKDQKILAKGIWYWAKTPAQYLASELCYWEWQDIIENSENT